MKLIKLGDSDYITEQALLETAFIEVSQEYDTVLFFCHQGYKLHEGGTGTLIKEMNTKELLISKLSSSYLKDFYNLADQYFIRESEKIHVTGIRLIDYSQTLIEVSYNESGQSLATFSNKVEAKREFKKLKKFLEEGIK